MEWINNLFFGTSAGHSIFLLAIVVAIGLLVGRVKVAGISLGVTFVLFIGIILSHFGMRMNHEMLHFFKEFGLILFVYSIGLQVGPGFFASLKSGGLKLNMIATGIVLLGVGITIALHYITGTDMATMTGILSGAITNTPGLGAAQQAFVDLHGTQSEFGHLYESIPMGYAVAYPLGVVGIIITTIILRYIMRVDLNKANSELSQEDNDEKKANALSLVVKNPALFGQKIGEIHKDLSHSSFVISRYYDCSNKSVMIAQDDIVMKEDDMLLVICSDQDCHLLRSYIGEEVQIDRKRWIPTESNLVSRRFIVSNKKINGKTLSELNLRRLEGVNVTRINRSGVEMVATAHLPLQIGDRLTIVGSEDAMKKMKTIIGDSVKRLNEPNLIGIFFGIALGVILGSIPIHIPGVPQAMKFGLAGGPLIVAILFSRFGYKYKIITYTTPSANLMLREIGICIFLACVGIGAGEGFVDTIASGGWIWVVYGVIITILPILIMGILSLKLWKVNYFVLMGLIAGSTTDPPALAYANSNSPNDAPAIGYATVYPLTMFLRVLTAQMLILFFC